VRVALAAAAALLTSGCTVSSFLGPEEPEPRPGVGRLCFAETERLPCGPGVAEGIPYRFVLLTHCGIESAYFDGRHWVAEPRLSDGSGNPPPGWDNPLARGTMTLVRGDGAEFAADTGHQARFAPAQPSQEPTGCA
jgi:hypothetical protein